jgi:hypothetical protein
MQKIVTRDRDLMGIDGDMRQRSDRFRAHAIRPNHLSSVLPGLDPGIHVDRRVKPGGDE